MHLPVGISDLKDTFMRALEEYRKNQHSSTLTPLGDTKLISPDRPFFSNI